MKAQHIAIIAVLIAAIVVSLVVIKKLQRKKLVDTVREKYGDIPGLAEKSDEELNEMLASGGDGQ